MSTIQQDFNNFRKDMDSLLSDIQPSDTLNQRVLEKINNNRSFPKFSKLKVSLAVSFATLILLMSVPNITNVSAQILLPIQRLASWIQSSTQVPVKIPSSWQQGAEKSRNIEIPQSESISPSSERPVNDELALKLEEANTLTDEEKTKVHNSSDEIEITDKRKYVYYEISRDKDSYSITAYRVKVPIPVNDRTTLLEKNGPVCQADVIGSISGTKITGKPIKSDAIFDTSFANNKFEIVSGITAYKDDPGCTVRWKQGNWEINYIGTSYGVETSLKSLAKELSNNSIEVASLKGKINISEGNKYHAFISWEHNGFLYTYNIPHSNWKEAFSVIKSSIMNLTLNLSQ